MHDLSKVDRRILALLQQDGRLSVAEIGRRVGLTPSPCADRIKRLESMGVIKGYQAKLSPEALDAGLVVFVQVRLQRTAGDAFEAFTEAIELIPEVEGCHLVSGDFDFLIKARVKDMSHYKTLLAGSLLQLPNVQESKSYPVMETVVARSGIIL
ncbi:MAG: AsnC family transcriptional regulator [Halieaceae bacterium MED-G27]|jgi:Lrp/AsnC family leucine-responsive transcriptional regulator|nr:AsnC family transcriptional regulator [Halieaceae bacterium]PDH36567.1 MAG: AsnC family transcriptional regulator [Halieaceae bacterium MED-G27]|tara:strand:+ start:2038 stop:2499 length:462 start_codon:yes stop_codon:yes gene_type:complete